MLDTRSHRRTAQIATCHLKIVRYSLIYKSQGHIRGGETTETARSFMPWKAKKLPNNSYNKDQIPIAI